MIPVQKLNLAKTEKALKCYHCGEDCYDDSIHIGEKVFCCSGCKLVYELLDSHEMCEYYAFEKTPGTSTPAEAGHKTKFQYLEDENVRNKLVQFSDGKTASVTFFIPVIHCSSCVWLLENLNRLNPLIISSRVNYLKKEVYITFEETAGSLRQVVELLASIGYEPQINLNSMQEEAEKENNRDLYIKIGVAGFSFANIMLFKFPEYLAGNQTIDPTIGGFFNYLSLLLALPVLLYSSQSYFQSALAAFKQRMVNMDVPISLGIITLFLRSAYEIVFTTSSGYMDSFAGLVFLLLIGKLFEKKTYHSLSFERDYKSYFPVAVTKKVADGETTIPLERLKPGDRIYIRNQELIPADSILIRGQAYIDYSFVTGESSPVAKQCGDMIYAGGKQVGGELEMDVVHDVNQSYLTELWNDEAFHKQQHSRLTTAANKISRYFTAIVLAIAFGSALYWAQASWTLALNAFTAVLIVACPCALALSTPFTLGNTLRVFGWNKFYLKNTAVIEAMSGVDEIVFDKTGTITKTTEARVEFNGNAPLTPEEKQMLLSLARQSTHPLSRHLAAYLNGTKSTALDSFAEEAGQGIKGQIGSHQIRLGNAAFTHSDQNMPGSLRSSVVHISIDGEYRGYFTVKHSFRSGLQELIQKLRPKFYLNLLSGDNDSEADDVRQVLGSDVPLHFNQSPFDKLDFVKTLQKKGKRVLMLGDGLNDAGALKISDVGITLTENINGFSPASDAILDAKEFVRLPDFLRFSRLSMRIIMASFIISFLYNLTGLYFAVQGTLSPLIAAVLMPASSISVVVFTTGSVAILAKKMGFRLAAEKGDAE